MKKFDVITFGSATLDILILANDLYQKDGFFLPLGEKIERHKMFFYSGGGGTNTAATFSLQGFKTAFCGMVGDDFAGDFILKELKKYGVWTNFVLKTKEAPTDVSIILTGKKGRVIFPCRSASTKLKFKEIPLEKLKAKWFYLASLSGSLKRDFVKIVNFAKKKGIKVALNPGKIQLVLPETKRILNKVDILILNEKEASILTKTSKEIEIFKKLEKLTKGIWIVTKGEKGCIVSDHRYLYSAGVLKVKVVDPTGAGDSFGAGFLAEYMRKKDIISAIQFASANAAANLEAIGAKEGILKKGEKYKKVKVKKIKFKK